MNNNLSLIKDVISDYNKFCEIAKKIEWLELYEEHEDWWNTYPLGIVFSIYEFPKDYIKNDILSSYVRIILSNIAFSEGWDKNFWDIDEIKREKYLKEGKSLYEPYAITKDIRFIERSFEYLKKEIQYYANANKIDILKQKRYLDKFEDAIVIEIGGCYSGDFEYLVIKDNFISIVYCGVWD